MKFVPKYIIDFAPLNFGQLRVEHCWKKNVSCVSLQKLANLCPEGNFFNVGSLYFELFTLQTFLCLWSGYMGSAGGISEYLPEYLQRFILDISWQYLILDISRFVLSSKLISTDFLPSDRACCIVYNKSGFLSPQKAGFCTKPLFLVLKFRV